MSERHIIAGSGGFIREGMHLRIGPILRYAFEVSGKKRPKFAYIGTASGDAPEKVARFYNACSYDDVEPSHLELFSMPNHDDIESYIMSQDVIWVGGGSVANLLAIWRLHGLDKILRKAWEAGIVLTGESAGSLCWHTGGTTDSFGLNLRPVTNGLGFIPFSSGVHYDSEPQRRPLFQKLIQEKSIGEGYATDDGVNLHFINTRLHQAVSDCEGKNAYHVYIDKQGKLTEEVITPTLLKMTK